jgi:phosphoribosyl-dephospho-CoA transferase
MCDAKQTTRNDWRRHDLLRLAPKVWTSVLAHSRSAADLPLMQDWSHRGWPVIVRRRACAEDPHLVPVGLPLPPAHGKLRIALLVPPGGILQRSSPPLLRGAAASAHPGWKSTIGSLLSLGDRIGVEPTAFGSLMWQHQTGLPYLSPTSDLDVLWPVPAGFDVRSLISGIGDIQRDATLRIDGEVIFPDGTAMNWRELWNAYKSDHRPKVLAKTMEGVRLLHLESLARVEQDT